MEPCREDDDVVMVVVVVVGSIGRIEESSQVRTSQSGEALDSVCSIMRLTVRRRRASGPSTAIMGPRRGDEGL